jgi:hypothetical protein
VKIVKILLALSGSLIAVVVGLPIIYRMVDPFAISPIERLLCSINYGAYAPAFYDCGYDYYSGEIIPMKPAVYLYPEEKTDVHVRVTYEPGFSATYPKYNNGWDVIAYPDGRLINEEDGGEYSYLFWEGNPDKTAKYDLTTGFVVKGEDTAEFLQNKLATIGLTPKEYNEFIVYWYPKMKQNPYNLIHFASKEEYEDKVIIDVSPKPDSVLRVFMVYKPLSEFTNVGPQEFAPFLHHGFTVVEWGGTELR